VDNSLQDNMSANVNCPKDESWGLYLAMVIFAPIYLVIPRSFVDIVRAA
jgi:hypothetical protein